MPDFLNSIISGEQFIAIYEAANSVGLGFIFQSQAVMDIFAVLVA